MLARADWPAHPVDRDVRLDGLHQLMCDDTQGWLTHELSRALVLGQRIVEGDFLDTET